ncbi:MAG: hypothetical protein EA397_02445 [Deltaproteobacteria bacterium]|nr:MAG: hypothetical protein EA397_02445 [Deltaproteobacteria bacterium]
MIPWLRWLGQLSRLRAVRRFHALRDDPERAQEQVLQEILAGLRGTGFEREYRLDRVRCLTDWQRAVPLQTPVDHQREVERILSGDRERLFHDPIKAWAGTSGSGGTRKLYPLTAAYRRQYLRTVASFLWHLTADHPRAFDHRVLYLTGPSYEGTARDGLPLASMSGYNASVQPGFVQARYAAPVEAANHDDATYLIARCALRRRISFAVSIMPSGLLGLHQTMLARAEELVRDLRDGTLHGAPAAAAPLALQPSIEPDPTRAAEVERLLQDAATLPEIWPDLRLLSCWKAAAAGAMLPQLTALAPGLPIRDAIYSATEGWLNVPLSDTALGGPAALTSHLIELVPEGGGEALLLHQAEVGARYRVVVSTTGGCYRYDLGDIVEVTGHWGRTPELVFVRKAGAASNLAGELLDGAQVLNAAAHAGDAAFLVMIPDQESSPPRYHLFVEHDAPQAFAECFEEALRRECVDYGPKQRAGALGALVVHPLPRRSWDRARKLKAAQGAIEAQVKPPVLTSDPGWKAVLEHLSEGPTL